MHARTHPEENEKKKYLIFKSSIFCYISWNGIFMFANTKSMDREMLPITKRYEVVILIIFCFIPLIEHELLSYYKKVTFPPHSFLFWGRYAPLIFWGHAINSCLEKGTFDKMIGFINIWLILPLLSVWFGSSTCAVLSKALEIWSTSWCCFFIILLWCGLDLIRVPYIWGHASFFNSWIWFV